MVAPELNIIRATENDAGLLSDLSNVTFIETFRGTCPDDDLMFFLDKCFNPTTISNELSDPDDLYYIVYSDGFPAGYMRLKEDYNEFPYMKKYKALQLKRIYVLEEFQGKKIGKELLNYALQIAADKDYEVLWLGVWEDNEKAKTFYQRFGFENTGYNATFNIGNTAQTDHWLLKFIVQR